MYKLTASLLFSADAALGFSMATVDTRARTPASTARAAAPTMEVPVSSTPLSLSPIY